MCGGDDADISFLIAYACLSVCLGWSNVMRGKILRVDLGRHKADVWSNA